MFQPLEVTEARTIWIDSPSNDRLGFQNSSRVQIDKDPMGTGDFSEPGDGFKATLLGGMWPDDDELRLLVIGIVPGSEMADNFMNRLAGTPHPDEHDPVASAWEMLRSMVQIMPSWSGQRERAMFVLLGLPRIKPETVKTAAVNSELNPDRKLSFDMFRIQVDAMLIAHNHHASDQWNAKNIAVMSKSHEAGDTPAEFIERKVDGRDETQSQDVPS